MRKGIVGPLIGQTVRRLEDRRLLRGEGKYVDDVVVPDMAHAAFLRSPHPHALITRIDAEAARALPGVFAVFTGRDIKKITSPMLGLMVAPGAFDPIYHALCIDRVRHIGDPVALVVAESRRVAEDALELIAVDYDDLPAVANAAQALDPERPPIWPDAGSNVIRRDTQVNGNIDAAFETADRVISERFTLTRHANQPMETRGSVAEYLPGTGTIRFHSSHQSVHLLKWGLGMFASPVPFLTGVRQLVKERDRLGRVMRGARQMAAAGRQTSEPERPPGFIAPPAADPKAAREPYLRQKQRFGIVARAMTDLLVKGPERVPEVVVQDVGGAFGSKGGVSREDVAVCAAAQHLRRSIKWIEDRNENLMVGGHARDESGVIELAVRRDGTILGMRVRLTIDMGAYPGFPFNAILFIGQVARLLVPGPYRVPALQVDQIVVSTNKATVVPYRGPWAVETFLRERILDVVAREVGISPGEMRRRNLVGPEELPRQMITGPMMDVRMSAKRTLTEALDIADADGWPAVQQKARAEGRILGMGVATFFEPAPGPPGYTSYVNPGPSFEPSEPMQAVLRSDGTVAFHSQQVPHGQGIATTMAQVAAQHLGVPYDSVQFVAGKTAETPFGIMGTAGSRSAAMAGGAVTVAARELRRLIVDVAADMLEASAEDITITDGTVHVVGVPSAGISIADVAAEAIRRPPPAGATRGSESEAFRISSQWGVSDGGWTQASHVCWVEVDLETGFVRIPRYVVVEDCGEIINPAIVDGQIRGGVAQGIGSVLYERIGYDDEANFTTGTYMDYLIPTAMEIPEIEIHHVQTPSDIEANYRGVGEGGMILAPAAVVNAIEDALSHLGVRITDQYLPPNRILELAGVVPKAAGS